MSASPRPAVSRVRYSARSPREESRPLSPQVSQSPSRQQQPFVFLGTLRLQILSARLPAAVNRLRDCLESPWRRPKLRGPEPSGVRGFSKDYTLGFEAECNAFVEVYCQKRQELCTVQRTSAFRTGIDGIAHWNETLEYEVEWAHADTDPPPLAFAALHQGEYVEQPLGDGELSFFLATSGQLHEWREWQVPLFPAVAEGEMRAAGAGGELWIRTQWVPLADQWECDWPDSDLEWHRWKLLRGEAVVSLDLPPTVLPPSCPWEVENQQTAAALEANPAFEVFQIRADHLGVVRQRLLQRYGRARELWLAAMAKEGRHRSETRMTWTTFAAAVRAVAPTLPHEDVEELWMAAGGAAGGVGTVGYVGFRRALEAPDASCW